MGGHNEKVSLKVNILNNMRKNNYMVSFIRLTFNSLISLFSSALVWNYIRNWVRQFFGRNSVSIDIKIESINIVFLFYSIMKKSLNSHARRPSGVINPRNMYSSYGAPLKQNTDSTV